MRNVRLLYKYKEQEERNMTREEVEKHISIADLNAGQFITIGYKPSTVRNWANGEFGKNSAEIIATRIGLDHCKRRKRVKKKEPN